MELVFGVGRMGPDGGHFRGGFERGLGCWIGRVRLFDRGALKAGGLGRGVEQLSC